MPRGQWLQEAICVFVWDIRGHNRVELNKAKDQAQWPEQKGQRLEFIGLAFGNATKPWRLWPFATNHFRQINRSAAICGCITFTYKLVGSNIMSWDLSSSRLNTTNLKTNICGFSVTPSCSSETYSTYTVWSDLCYVSISRPTKPFNLQMTDLCVL